MVLNQKKLLTLIDRFRRQTETEVSSEFISELINDLIPCVNNYFSCLQKTGAIASQDAMRIGWFHEEILEEISDICLCAMQNDPAGLKKLDDLMLNKLAKHFSDPRPTDSATFY
ncbi:MAG: hypothetical protein PHV02_10125 [Rhodocyclaceae bacterium]|nr:hypothetical protein [Rhodocyclaceae bacterium]